MLFLTTPLAVSGMRFTIRTVRVLLYSGYPAFQTQENHFSLSNMDKQIEAGTIVFVTSLEF